MYAMQTYIDRGATAKAVIARGLRMSANPADAMPGRNPLAERPREAGQFRDRSHTLETGAVTEASYEPALHGAICPRS